jgi:hypothetical protein
MLRTLFVGLPALFLVLGISLALRVVPQNKFYGFRTSATFSSPDTWYQINFATGLALIAAGVMVRTPRFNAQLRAYRPKGRKSLHCRHYAN